MLKLFKYLKTSIVSILIIVALLICQAALDLTLPDYTSKIINVGIGQKGLDKIELDVITETTLNDLNLFFTEEEQEIISSGYYLLERNKENVKDYPALEKMNVFKFNGINKQAIAKLLEKGFTLLSASSMISSNEGIQIPSGFTFVDTLKGMDVETRAKTITMIEKEMKKFPQSMIESNALEKVKQEYIKIGISLDDMQSNYILTTGIKMLFVALLIMAADITVIFFGSRLSATLGKTLRLKVFKKVTSFSKSEIKNFGTASLITRTTNDIAQVQQVILMLLRVVFYAPIIAIGGILKTTSADNSMLWIVVIAVITLLFIVGILFITVIPKFKIFQTLIDKLNLVSREILTGIPVIRAFSNEKHEEERFDDANKKLTKVNLFVNRTMALMMPLMMLLMNIVSISIVWFGAIGVDAGTIQVGDILAYIQYTMQIIMSFLMISMISIILPRASVSAKRIVEVLETNSSVLDVEKDKKINNNKKGLVEFKNVCFRYPDANEDVITDINFVAHPGEVIAFMVLQEVEKVH